MPIQDLAGNNAANFSNEPVNVSTGGAAGVCIAFTDLWNEPNPVWTRIDDPNGINIVDSWSTDFGRSSEMDHTKNGAFTINLIDRQGVLDPTNTTSPILNLGTRASVAPMRQVAICLKNPVTGVWYSRARGFVDEVNVQLDEAENVFRGTIECVGLFSVLSSIEVIPDSGSPNKYGDPVPTNSAGDVFYENAEVDDRIRSAYGDAGIDSSRTVVFSGNVWVQETVYAVRSTIMQIIQDAADAEFPGVANNYEDRFGRGVFHGRGAKFNAEAVSMNAEWDFHHWYAGDNAKWSTDTIFIPIKTLEFNTGMAFILNAVLATPQNILDADIAGQLSTDAGSIATYGVRSASWENLVTDRGKNDGLDKLRETQLFSSYYAVNYQSPRNRITQISFHNLRASHPNTDAFWNFATQADISDKIDVVTTHPGGGGFNETFFIEGIRVSASKLGDDDYHLVTVDLDLSPEAYFSNNPFEPGATATRTVSTTEVSVTTARATSRGPRTSGGSG